VPVGGRTSTPGWTTTRRPPRAGDPAPGVSYRWRARVDDLGSFTSPFQEQQWSPWCEFTVSADAVDYRGLGAVSLEALTELGLRPDRTYTVNLSGRQQQLWHGTGRGQPPARIDDLEAIRAA
jgi:hypothetical protein